MLEKQFDPKDAVAEQILDKGTRLVIPRFQRAYAWKNENLEEFYTDFIKSSKVTNQNFLGTLVFDVSKDGRYEIIDGQQRVITITILLAVIRDLLREDLKSPSAYELAGTIQNDYILAGSSLRQRPTGDADSGGSIYILTAEKGMREFFEHFILKGDLEIREKTLPKNEGEKNTQNAYLYFKARLKKDKLQGKVDADGKTVVLRKLAESILGIQFVLINVYNSDMAYALFESHNAKGADLLISDLVKSYFYGQLKGPEDTKERYVKEWDRVVQRLRTNGGFKIDKFLHYHQQSYDGKFTKAQLYKKIKISIGTTEPEAIKFIKNLSASTDLLLQLKSGEIESTEEYYIPYETKEKLNKSLGYIADFHVDQCYILLLSILRNRQKFTPTYLKKIIELVENFTFIYSKISKGQANVLENIYAQLAEEIESDDAGADQKAVEIFSGQKYSKLEKLLLEQIQFEYFAPKFKDLDYTKPQQKKLIQYIFAKMEYHLNRGGTVLGIDSNLDHISAQNLKSPGSKLTRLHNIGNLVPIDKVSNSKLGNKAIKDKIDVYKEIQNITLVRNAVDFLEEHGNLIDDEIIDHRGEQLADVAYNQVWKIA